MPQLVHKANFWFQDGHLGATPQGTRLLPRPSTPSRSLGGSLLLAPLQAQGKTCPWLAHSWVPGVGSSPGTLHSQGHLCPQPRPAASAAPAKEQAASARAGPKELTAPGCPLSGGQPGLRSEGQWGGWYSLLGRPSVITSFKSLCSTRWREVALRGWALRGCWDTAARCPRQAVFRGAAVCAFLPGRVAIGALQQQLCADLGAAGLVLGPQGSSCRGSQGKGRGGEPLH